MINPINSTLPRAFADRVAFCAFAPALLAIVAVGWSSTARADTLPLETANITLVSQEPSGARWDSPEVTLYTNSNHTSSVQATLSEGGATNWSNPTQVSGPNDFTFTGNPLTAPSGQFISFCIELTQDISLNHTYTVDAIPLDMAPKPVSGQLTSGMGPTAAGLIEELWAAHFHDIFYQPNSSDPNLQSVQNSNAAAFQLAIWKLEYDGGQYLDFSEGSLQVAVGDSDDLLDPSVLTAKSWLKDIDLNGNGPKASLLALTGHGSINFQDQVVQVPEPSSLVFISLGALGMAVARRGRRRGQ